MSASIVHKNLSQARRDLVAGLNRRHIALALCWFAVALVPLLGNAFLSPRALAWLVYFAVAVSGLQFVMGLGNMSSIGHGAFVAIGALITTLARTRLSLEFVSSLAVGSAATALAAFLVGHGVIRLRAIHLAVSTWLGAWLMALLLSSSPGISGGAAGLVVPEAVVGGAFGFEWRLTPLAHYWIALALLALLLVLFRSMSGSSLGLMFATIKQNPREAAVIGTLSDGPRLKLFVFGATVAGLAGGLGVHLSGIFDHSSFGVVLSVALFLAVLVGQAAGVFAPIVGALVISLLPLKGQPLTPFVSFDPRAGELLAGSLLLGVLLLGTSIRRPPLRRRPPALVMTERPMAIIPMGTPHLAVEAATKSFSGLVALDGVDLEISGGEVHGIMGPNGSGKSTLLALISGHLLPDSGRIALDGKDITHLDSQNRLRLGLSRSLQSTELFPELTALEHLEAASLVDRRYAGFFRSTLRTPRARSEEASARREALALLEELGLAQYREVAAEEIAAGARRLLMMGMAIGGRRVILLDEPSAGMSEVERVQAASIIVELKRSGVAVVVVEHHMRLLRKVADTITVLDNGRVIARGLPSAVYDDPEVRRAYLGFEKEPN